MIKVALILILLLKINIFLTYEEESCIGKENKYIFNVKKEIKSKYNNNYTLSFHSKNYEELIITAEPKDINNKVYTKTFSLDDIKEKELTPSSFNITPTQIYKRLFEIISKEKIYLKEEYESLKISFKIENQTKKDINFTIPEKKENYNKELMKLIYELKKQVDILEVQIKELKEITELKKSKNIIHNLNNIIVGNNYEYNYLLKKWINPYNKLEANLLYKLSRDGPESTTFHKLCDNKGATLTLFYLKTGEKVGFYLSDPFDSDSGWKYDENIFIFNLNKKQQYKKKVVILIIIN